MPQYVYRCSECEYEFEIRHTMSEQKTVCPDCNAGDSLFKIPLIQNNQAFKPAKAQTGTIVDDFIKEAKKELNLEKKKMKGQERK